jgi:hypothetical protein
MRRLLAQYGDAPVVVEYGVHTAERHPGPRPGQAAGLVADRAAKARAGGDNPVLLRQLPERAGHDVLRLQRLQNRRTIRRPCWTSASPEVCGGPAGWPGIDTVDGTSPENQIRLLRAIERHFAEHLGGVPAVRS